MALPRVCCHAYLEYSPTALFHRHLTRDTRRLSGSQRSPVQIRPTSYLAFKARTVVPGGKISSNAAFMHVGTARKAVRHQILYVDQRDAEEEHLSIATLNTRMLF